MLHAPHLRLRTAPTRWHHSIHAEHNNEHDTRTVKRRVTAGGMASSDVHVTFIDGGGSQKSASEFSCDLSFAGGGELPIKPDDHAPRLNWDAAEPMSKHCGWVHAWKDKGSIALSVELRVPDDIFGEIYERLKSGYTLPTEIWVSASASTFVTVGGPFAEWNITKKTYLYISDFSIFYPPVNGRRSENDGMTGLDD